MSERIIADPVPELRRQGFLAASFGAQHVVRARTILSSWMTALSQRGERPQWRFFSLSNGGFYVAPIHMTPLASLYRGREFDGRVTSDAAGVIATLLTLNQLERETHADAVATRRVLLRAFAEQHVEWHCIKYAIT